VGRAELFLWVCLCREYTKRCLYNHLPAWEPAAKVKPCSSPGRCARLRSRRQLWGPSFSPIVSVNAMWVFPESHVYACVQSPCGLQGERKAQLIGRWSSTNPATFPLPSQAHASVFTCCFLQCLSHSPLTANILPNKIFITNRLGIRSQGTGRCLWECRRFKLLQNWMQ